MEEEGGWPKLGLLLLSGVAMLWLVLSCLLYLVWLCMPRVSYVSVEYLAILPTSISLAPVGVDSWGVL